MIPGLLLALLLQVTPELRQHVEAGLKAKNAGDLEAAAREFQRVTQLAPEMAAAHVNLGSVLYEKRDYAGAIPALRKALELNPALPGAKAMLGASLLAQGYASEAIPLLEGAQSDDLLGVAYLETGRPRDAVDRLEAALQKRPDDPDLLYYLGQAHGQLTRQVFEKLRAAQPNSARVEQMLGEAAAAEGKREAAEQHLRKALGARPDLRGAHLALGQLFLAAGAYEKAETEFRAEVAKAPGSAEAAYHLGAVLLNQGKSQEALTELRRADGLRPGMPETLVELGKAYTAQGDLKGAAQSFRQVIEAEPDSSFAATAHLQLAQIYRKQGRETDAARELEQLKVLRTRQSRRD